MSPNLAALVKGIAVTAFGIVLLLDRMGDVDLDFGSVAPLALALVGVVLLASGLVRRDAG